MDISSLEHRFKNKTIHKIQDSTDQQFNLFDKKKKKREYITVVITQIYGMLPHLKNFENKNFHKDSKTLHKHLRYCCL